ncbi:ATBF1 [Mytilus edulis]|uniref:ATBF1 n=1 Tax=Mytilus edulis TaxID=6550 RepID=A0A8S3RJK6_MYTED|nr:ATBF1 [Mytilus edulis]
MGYCKGCKECVKIKGDLKVCGENNSQFILNLDGELDDEDTVTSSYENDIQDKFDHPTTSKENTPESLDRTKTPTESKEDQIHVCPYCNYSSVNEMRIQAHVISQHSQNDSKILCPLCQEDFKEKRGLEKHLMNTHSVKPEGLQRLLLMVDQGDWMMPPTSIPTVTPFMPIDESGEINTEALEAEAARLAAEEAIDTAAVPDKNDADDQYRCQTCSKTFINIDGLYAHQNELGHLELKQTPRGPGYLCWKKGCNQYFKTAQALQVHFREIHAKRQPNITDHSAYKYECNQCSLAFKSPDKLQLHSHFHLIQSATRCSFCSRSFRSIAALRKHIDTGHSEISDIEKEQYHASMNVASMALGAVLKQSGVENLSDIISTNSEGSTTIVNAVTTPVTSAIQAEKLLAKTDMNSNETVGKVDESMDTDNSSLIENDDEDESMDTNEREDAGDMPYKEQQFLEDYINSQAIAENSYEDPSRKFKCHRCRLAFTKQNYLTAHNKTLLHRRGDKMSYPMEKYLDPNRPFKCDVCKESFTQKNILLVHYNSVSHLHKLKQITQGSPSSMSTQQAESSDSELINTTTTSPIVNGESDKLKPYKCNICKVSYSQGTTLDIHIRSVSHQNKASKLQELVLTGQVDIMQPLIEQPSDPQMSQQQKMLSEIIAQQSSAFNQSMLFSGMPGFGDFGQFPMTTGLPLLLPKMSIPETVTTSSTSTKSSTVIKSERIDSKFGISEQEEMNGLHMLAQAAANNDIVKKELAELVKDSPSVVGPTYLCQLCNAVFTNQDSLQQHQIMCMYQAGMTTPTTHMKPKSLMGRVSSQVHRNLLENIGFECVMQFNEFNNQPASMREEALDKAETEFEIKKEIKEEKDDESEKKEDLPELNKGVCPTCHKEFSSVWVLKAHQEEVHKEVVPTIFIEDFGEQFKNDMDIKQAKESDSLQLGALNDTAIKEGSVKDMPPPPAPPPPPPLMSPQVDMSQMMSMYGMHLPMPLNMAMMNMQPQLMPMMFPVSTPDGMTSPMGVGDAGLQSLQSSQSKMPSGQQAAAVAAMQNQNKRARTRINDEQLKVLRAYFDINNSPSEEQINAMSEQSGLPTKVIKHWFRNTLFKERQRNKDSPYNFNNPPLTTLDLEEYEKTGKITSSDDPHEIVIKKEVDIVEEPSIGRISEKEELPPLTQTKPNPSPIVSLQLTAPISALKLEPPPKTESPKSQDTMMDDSDSMSNSSGPLAASSFSAPPPLVNINMSTALSFSSNAEEIRPRFEFSPHHSAYNKRANRTRFTDYQIKVLQEYFEQNAYPKDDELDHLSKILNLSPRVIVVWFQNARQKARKIYENQPNPEVAAKETSSNSPFNRTAGLNYQCKKCTAVFQRYYDLIRHQKKHCNAGDTDKSMSVSTYNEDDDSNDSLSSMSKDELNLSEDGSLNSYELSGEQDMSTGIKFNCEKCNKSFDKLEAWRDHQNIHMSGNPFSGLATNSAFGVLQNMAAAQQMESDKLKRKYEVFLDDDDHDQPRDKRLRTTILPEQLDYLYQKYQLDCNPSRKQLENISRDVNLKKRVVQVWFQNTRARERKGQYRAHQQLIHKRCPFCRALFRAKSALESHLATKHPEEMAKGDINIDNIPDAALESPSECLSAASTMFTSTPTSADFSKMISPQSMQSFLPILPSPGALPGLPNDPLQMSMTKFYADSFKKYMNELSAPESNEEEKIVPLSSPSPVKTHESKPKPSLSSNDDEAPLDLSKPLKVKVENEKISDGPSTDISENSSDNMNMSRHFDDSASDVSMNKSDYYNNSQHAISTSGPNSPVSVTHSSSLSASQASKRYRTQMTSLQVRIMKTIFVDYKTPTMAECEMLGRIIGLQKRVVQVWFQNARAKEKKSKLQMSKTYGTNPDLDFHKPPEECKLCNFKYSHKYTIQDHIFTKKHIEHVRNYVQSQSEAESHLSSQGMAGLTGSLNKQTDRKQWEDQSSQSHLAQLQSMGMGMPLAGLSGLGSSFNPSDILKKDKDNSGDKKSSEGSNKDLMNMDPTQLAAMMSSPFSGFFPGIDPAMLPYMYAGFPGYMPGMGMPFMPPGFMPGAEQLMGGFDPMSFGTPLPLLQIPPQAIKDVSVKLSEPKASVAQYTQDCKSISSLKSLVNNVDYLCVRESTVDVGYICKKCQMVYPGKEACLGHQRTMCFAGGKIPDNISPVLKLEQIQYECKLCSDKSSTVQEYKSHCQSEGHKAKTARIQNKSGKIHSPVSSVPPSPSKTPSSSNPSVSPLPKTDLNSPGFSRPKDNASNAK